MGEAPPSGNRRYVPISAGRGATTRQRSIAPASSRSRSYRFGALTGPQWLRRQTMAREALEDACPRLVPSRTSE